jgi:hypothetical protein
MTDSFAGDLGRVTLWPFAMSASRAKASYRQQNNLAQWVGISGENASSDTNRAPTAVPVQETLTAGVAKTIDVIARAYDADGDALSIQSGSLSPSTGTASIVSGQISWTAANSFTGAAECGFTLRDGGGKSSAARVYAQVEAGTPPSAELPTALRSVNVSTAAQLTAALAGNSSLGALQPGDHIILANGEYGGGTFTLSRSGTAPTNANRTGVPIVVRAANIGGARFRGRFNVTGVNGWLHGLDFDGRNTSNVIQEGLVGSDLGGDHSRVMRCVYHHWRTINADDPKKGGKIAVSYGARYNKIWFCEFHNFDGRGITGKTNDTPLFATNPKYPHVAYCHWHDNLVPTDDGNGRECLQFGQTQGKPNGQECRVYLRGLVEHCRIERCYTGGKAAGHDENEPISIKSCGSIARFVTFGSGMSGLINIRFGIDCEVSSCLIKSGVGIGCFGDNNLLISNEVQGSAQLVINAGNQTMDFGATAENAAIQAAMTGTNKVWYDPQANPFARDARVISCRGELEIGNVTGTTAGKPTYKARGTKVYAHNGTITSQEGGGSSTANGALREHQTTYSASAAGQPSRPAATEVTTAMVGPGAPWVAPSLWPATL